MGVRVLDILKQYDGCCLDNEPERLKVAEAVELALAAERCDDCDHEEDVHQEAEDGTKWCLGGPGAYHTCNCKGFRKDK